MGPLRFEEERHPALLLKIDACNAVHQNCLRHSGYERLFVETGMRTVANRRIVTQGAEQDALKAAVGPAFKTVVRYDLVTANMHCSLRRNSTAMATV
jgi:hypothetical protein